MQTYGRTEKMRIPATKLARKGDGIGCRTHEECRHNPQNRHAHDPFWVIQREVSRRAARILKGR